MDSPSCDHDYEEITADGLCAALICTKCGDITEFVDEQIESRQHKIAQTLGFDMQDHSMQIYGICKNCQN